MTDANRDEYDRAKRLALAALEAHKERAKLREPPSPDRLMQAIKQKTARGEVLTEQDMAALSAALAAANPPSRGRGRPKGTKDMAAKRAFRAALIATHDKRGLQLYRNSATGYRPTLCDALAEAMNEAGFNSLTTYDAAAAEMKATRKSIRQAAERIRPVLERVHAQLEGTAERGAAIAARMREAMTVKLPPETLEAIEKASAELRKSDKTED